jgi:hypothetical protein
MTDANRPRRENLPPSEIEEDPARFQSRADYPRDWTDSDLDDVAIYNVDFGGVISVWRAPEDGNLYVIDGHRRLRLAKRARTPLVYVQFLEASTDADAFAKGVVLNIAERAFERGDKLLWATASRRAAVERALHTRWLDVDGEAAAGLYEYYPDLGRRYSSRPKDYMETARD